MAEVTIMVKGLGSTSFYPKELTLKIRDFDSNASEKEAKIAVKEPLRN